jgi:hypothetical protein
MTTYAENAVSYRRFALAPDVPVAMTSADFPAQRDRVLARALRAR